MKNLLVLLSIVMAGPIYAEEANKFTDVAKASWLETFQDSTYCPMKAADLASRCVVNQVSVLCETAPKAFSGDGNCYELLEVFAFIPAEYSESGKLQIIGKTQPTW